MDVDYCLYDRAVATCQPVNLSLLPLEIEYNG